MEERRFSATSINNLDYAKTTKDLGVCSLEVGDPGNSVAYWADPRKLQRSDDPNAGFDVDTT